MTTRRKYKQLKLGIDSLQRRFDEVPLCFSWQRHLVKGVLKGNSRWWIFKSVSRPFLKVLPSGQLSKYALWTDGVPDGVSELYNGIWEAAAKAGYDLSEED